MGEVEGASGAANEFTPAALLIPGYCSTDRTKTGIWLCYNAATAFIGVAGVSWASTAAINRIDVFGSLADLASGSRVTVYGMP